VCNLIKHRIPAWRCCVGDETDVIHLKLNFKGSKGYIWWDGRNCGLIYPVRTSSVLKYDP
jgi:hypothetical protein